MHPHLPHGCITEKRRYRAVLRISAAIWLYYGEAPLYGCIRSSAAIWLYYGEAPLNDTGLRFLRSRLKESRFEGTIISLWAC